MVLHRRKFLGLAAAALGCSTFSPATFALDYPTRPVHFIVSFAAGGPNDTIARILGQYLSEYFGQQFVVENRVGAGGNIGMEVVLSSPPDGYTIGFVAPNNAINTTLYEHLPFDFLRDSTPVAGTMKLANVMDVNLSVHRDGESQSGQDQFRFRRGRHFAAHVQCKAKRIFP
jgi:tripartite-type tricarboxylate transporter receptor subunit TctC